ncbi:MAG: hypothetical protein ACK5WC_04610, partial [Aphanizomenon sp.]
MSDLQSQNPLNANANLVGIGMDNQLWTRKNYLTSNWEHIPNSGLVLAITFMPDGTLVGIGMDHQLWTRKNYLTSNWEHIPNSGAVLAITAMPDGTLVGIGMDHQLWTRKTLTSNWQHIPNSGAVLGIAYYPAVRQPVLKPLNGQIVVNADEWTLSNQGFQKAPDTATFVTNIAQYFVGDEKGKFHVLSNNFGLTQS